MGKSGYIAFVLVALSAAHPVLGMAQDEPAVIDSTPAVVGNSSYEGRFIASSYRHDNGVATTYLGSTSTTFEVLWVNRFVATGDQDAITSISAAWGSVPAGTTGRLYIWTDPNNDGNPNDRVLAAQMDVTIDSPCTCTTPIMTVYTLPTPVPVSGTFYVGASATVSAGQFVVPVDLATPFVAGRSQLAIVTPPATANSVALGQRGSIANPETYILRANGSNAGFTYQGSLNVSDAPYTGDADLLVGIFDASTGGNAVSAQFSIPAVSVKNGLFSVRVPADASSFDPGADRWLEIGVKRTGEAGYTTLSPRQRITSVPTALAAARVNWNGVFNAPASFPPWTQVSNGISYSAGRVGIGTSAPSNTLHVQGTALFSGPTNGGRIMTTDFAAAGGTQLLGIVSGNNTGPQFRFNTSTTATNFIDVGQNADGDFVVEGNDVPRLVVANSGNVGIGNGTPGYKLDITGNLRATVPSEREVIRLTDGTRSLTSWIGNAGFPGGDGAFFGTTSNHPLVLQTGNNAWVALLPNGNLGIGTLLPGERMDVAGNIRLPRGNKIYFGPESENTDPIYLQAWNNVSNNTIFELVLGDDPAGGAGGESFVISTRAIGGGAFNPRFYFNSDGNAFKAGTQPGWGSISDRRVKHDVSDLHGGLDRLLALRGKTFFYNDPRAMGAAPGLRTGFIAQDVETIFPEWVGQLSDGTKTLTIGGGAFEANTVEALRELRAEKDAQIQELRKQNEALRAENAARQREVDALRGNTEAMTAELNEFKVQLKRIESAISRRAK